MKINDFDRMRRKGITVFGIYCIKLGIMKEGDYGAKFILLHPVSLLCFIPFLIVNTLYAMWLGVEEVWKDGLKDIICLW